MFGIQKPPGEVGETGPAIIIGLFVAFGGILYGFVFPATLFVFPL